MVNLLSGSAVDPNRFPNAFRWDDLVRKHYQQYQRLIDAQTYRLQRIQRGLLALPYPRYYGNELLSLRLLKRKQQVGEVDQSEVDMYKNINPCIATHFNRAFDASLRVPIFGAAVGGALLAYSSYFSFSIPTRFALTVVPVYINWLWNFSDPKDHHKSLEFLDWVVGYRKAKCWVQLHHKQFQHQETKKVIHGNSLVDLGTQLISLASK